MALAHAGKGDVDGLRAALDLYLKHHEHVRQERGKVLCHTGPEGNASYYLLYGCAFGPIILYGGRATRKLGLRERGAHADKSSPGDRSARHRGRARLHDIAR